MDIFHLYQGKLPLLVSMPHTGIYVPEDIKSRMNPDVLHLPDTDWHMEPLYSFGKEMGISLLAATHSRYVVDLNRSVDDVHLYPGQLQTGLCPTESFEGDPVYQGGAEIDEAEKRQRIAAYWQPYHDALARELARLKDEHGYAILFDGHSICSQVPRLFEGALPDLNLGTAKGESCAPEMEQAAYGVAQQSPFSHVLNGRFIGGFITRHYGQPDQDIHAMQMELTWKNYMDEIQPYTFLPARAEMLQQTLRDMFDAILAWAADHYAARSGVSDAAGIKNQL